MDAGIAGVIGVLIGGLIASVAKWIEQRSQWNIERRRMYLGKLEDLHARCHELRHNTGDLCSTSESFATTWKDPDLAVTRFEKDWKSVVRSAADVTSLAELYLPGLNEDTVMDIWVKTGDLKRNEGAYIFSRGEGEFSPRNEVLVNLFQAIERVELHIIEKLRLTASIT